MGLLDRRKRKVAENAAEHMDGEEIRELVMAQTKPSWIWGSASSKVHAVAATDQHVYAFAIHDWKPTQITEVALRRTHAEMPLTLDGGTLVFGDGEGELEPLLGAGKDAKRLVEFSQARGAA